MNEWMASQGKWGLTRNQVPRKEAEANTSLPVVWFYVNFFVHQFVLITHDANTWFASAVCFNEN